MRRAAPSRTGRDATRRPRRAPSWVGVIAAITLSSCGSGGGAASGDVASGDAASERAADVAAVRRVACIVVERALAADPAVPVPPPEAPLAAPDPEIGWDEDALSLQTSAEIARDVLSGRDDRAERPTGLDDALAILAAVHSARAERIATLERVASDAADPLDAKVAWNLLEQDDRWLARELERDAVYSRFAGAWNGLLQMGYAALQGNPFGVARPIVAGVEGVIAREALDPAERKKIQLHRRWTRRHGARDADAEDAPDLRDLEEDVAALRRAMREEELRLGRALLARGRPEAAVAHAEVARLLADPATAAGPRAGDGPAGAVVVDPEVEALFDDVEAHVIARRERLERSLGVDAAGLSDPAAARAIAAEVATRVAGEDATGGSPSADPGARARAAVELARDDIRSRTWRYVATGRRDVDDPLLLRRQVRRDMERSVADVLSVVLWPPIALARGVHAMFGRPIDDRTLVDALARAALAEPDPDRRRPFLEELADRYEDRGEEARALAIVRALGDDPSREAALAEDVAEEARVREEAQGAADLALTLPVAALGDLGVELGVDSAAIDPPRLELTEGGVRYALRDGGVVEREVPSELGDRLRALAAEWRWRREALARRGHAEASEGVPVALEAGVGASGVTVLPRLLPEGYVARDRRYFE